MDLRPNGDGATLDWTPTPAGTHFTTIDEDVDSPDTADRIENNILGEVDLIDLEDAPGDYVSSNSVNLRVHGQNLNFFTGAYRCELRQADETVLASVTFGPGDLSARTVESGPQTVNLSRTEIDELFLRFEVSIGGGLEIMFAFAAEVVLDYETAALGGRILPLLPMVSYIIAAWEAVVAVVIKSGKETGVAHDTVTTISFTTAFATTPNVVVTIDRTAVTDIKFLQVTNILTTAFDVRFKFKTAATTDIQWIATDAGDP